MQRVPLTLLCLDFFFFFFCEWHFRSYKTLRAFFHLSYWVMISNFLEFKHFHSGSSLAQLDIQNRNQLFSTSISPLLQFMLWKYYLPLEDSKFLYRHQLIKENFPFLWIQMLDLNCTLRCDFIIHVLTKTILSTSIQFHSTFLKCWTNVN